MKNYKIETSDVSPKVLKNQANKTRGKLSVIQCILDFSVWLKTGSNPAKISRFRIHTGKIKIPNMILLLD